MGRPSLMLQRLALLRGRQCHRLTGHREASIPRATTGPLSPLPGPSSCHQQHHHPRPISTTTSNSNDNNEPQGKIGADEDAVAALFDGALGAASGGKGLDDPRRRRVKDRDADRPKLLTARREALALYREVLRTSNLFVWRDERGAAWRGRIRASARQEFEAARREDDPELISRMIVTARDAVHRAVDQFRERRAAIIDDEARRADAGVMAPVAGVGGGGSGGGVGGSVGGGSKNDPRLPSWSQGVPLVRGGGGGGGGTGGASSRRG